MRKWIKIACALLLSLSALVGCSRRKQPETLRANSKDLPNTQITSHLEEKIVPGKNLIYCSTFQLAWNELRDNIIEEDIRLENEPPMVKILNKKVSSKADISEDCYVAMAGFVGDGIVEEINEALRSKFGDSAPTVEMSSGREYILAYAFLLKDLSFPVPFENLREPLEFRSRRRVVRVKAFGIEEHMLRKRRHAQMGKQVSVLAYDYGTDECVIRLTSRSPEDEIILARVNPRGTLLETIQSVQNMIEGGHPESLQDDDAPQIPKLDFDIRHSYSELLKKYFLNEGFTNAYISKARQDIRFRLNERGALLRSEARIEVTAEGEKNLIFDGPFLLYLKEKQSRYPYLAIWVDNAEILLRH